MFDIKNILALQIRLEFKMFLTGNLDKIFITEILYSLLFFDKTGILRCSSPVDETISFYVREGNLEKILNPWEDLKLGSILFRRGYINEKELNRALKQQHELKKQLGEIFIQMNLLTRQHLTKMLRMQFEQVILRVAAFEESVFNLEEYPEEEPQSVFLFSKSEQNILGHVEELNSKVRRFKTISFQLPPNDTVLIRDSEVLKASPKITEKEESRQILKLADGTRTLREIRRECAYNTLEAQAAILYLYQNKIIKKKET